MTMNDNTMNEQMNIGIDFVLPRLRPDSYSVCVTEQFSIKLTIHSNLLSLESMTVFPDMKMSSYHKPRVFRSNEGCCICKAKSSSSRFTDSGKYENSFTPCFKLEESHKRHGDICNACVLIVKRWRVLPKDTDKDWHHVVDSRVGPGGSKVTFRNVKRKAEPESEEKFEKIRKKKQKLTVKRVTEHVDNISDSISGFIDTTYFKR